MLPFYLLQLLYSRKLQLGAVESARGLAFLNGNALPREETQREKGEIFEDLCAISHSGTKKTSKVFRKRAKQDIQIFRVSVKDEREKRRAAAAPAKAPCVPTVGSSSLEYGYCLIACTYCIKTSNSIFDAFIFLQFLY